LRGIEKGDAGGTGLQYDWPERLDYVIDMFGEHGGW